MDAKPIIARLGGPAKVAALCGGITSQAVSQWYGTDRHGRQRRIPPARLMYLQLVRPDLFPKPPKEQP